MKHRNIEVKLRIHDLTEISARLLALGAIGPIHFRQEDSFYLCNIGRLKLRRSGTSAELIYYQRADVVGPKLSEYWRMPISNPDQLHEILLQSNGLLGVVRKYRQLYRIGRARIHLDEVEQLGTFLEIEVVLEESANEVDGQRETVSLIAELGLTRSEQLFAAYVDLLFTKC